MEKIVVELTKDQQKAVHALKMIAILSRNQIDLLTFENKFNTTPEEISESIWSTIKNITYDLNSIPSSIRNFH